MESFKLSDLQKHNCDNVIENITEINNNDNNNDFRNKFLLDQEQKIKSKIQQETYIININKMLNNYKYE
jgi:hypothetical protein